MDVTSQKKVTAQMKITKPDGRVIVQEVELDEESIARILKESEDARQTGI